MTAINLQQLLAVIENEINATGHRYFPYRTRDYYEELTAEVAKRLVTALIEARKALEFYGAQWGNQFGTGGMLRRDDVKKILDDSCATAREALAYIDGILGE